MCNRRSSWFCDKILKKVLVCSVPCVLSCNGHQKPCVFDVDLPLVDVQGPEHEAGALSRLRISSITSCQVNNVCFSADLRCRA